jgi:integrase
VVSVSITKRKNRYTVQVRKWNQSVSATFSRIDEAITFKKRVLKALDQAIAEGVSVNLSQFKPGSIPEQADYKLTMIQPKIESPTPDLSWTLKRAIEEYERIETPRKKGALKELNRFKHIKSARISKKRLGEIKIDDIFEWKENLVNRKTGKPLAPQTVRNYVHTLSLIFEKARLSRFKNGWGLDIKNHIRDIEIPRSSKTTEIMRISSYTLERFFERLHESYILRYEHIELFFKIALSTGMRRSEIVNLRYSDFFATQEGLTIHLKNTKSGYSREVFLNRDLSKFAVVLNLRNLSGDNPNDKVLNFSENTVSKIFKDIVKTISPSNIRLHDLRHEALSRMADAGFSLKELMSMSGHRTASVSARYLHVSEKSLRHKLEKIK